MSKEAENRSFNERSSLSGNSGALGLSSVKPKLQPIRIKAFLDMYPSDEEDSEDKGKDSNSDSDCDDVQPLPEDDKQVECLTTVVEETASVQDSRIVRDCGKDRSPVSPLVEKADKSEDDFRISRKFGAETEERRRRGSSAVRCLPRARSSEGDASDEPWLSNRRSNVQFEAPESHARSSQMSLPIKAESMTYSSQSRVTDPRYESSSYSRERQNVGTVHSEAAPGCASCHVTDTPMKNNPPAGSTRPTPSASHRSMFQTPRSAAAAPPPAESRQTPASLFGNWSKTHMARTPLESRASTAGKSQPALSLVSQALSSHEPPHGSNEEKRGRRPLTETVESVRCNQQLSRRYNVAEPVNDASVDDKAILRDSKENRRSRSPREDHASTKDNEESSVSRKSAKQPTIAGKEIEKENAPSIVNAHNPYERHSSLPSVAAPIDKINAPERRNNVQVSIPSRIRRPNQGQTITVRGKEYLVLGVLGEGMSGQVLRVQEVDSLDLRAIKVVDLSRMDKDCAQGCLQEISMLHKLQASCVVKMFDHEIKYPMVHVVLEMGDTDFKSLLISMSEKNRLPLTMILYYWTEMLTAVKHIHDNGVIHSDLKPANFLLVRGRLKLIDFGIASSMNADMTSVVKNNPIGTLNYISPEALMDISGNSGDSPNCTVKYKISFKSDVWSLGCILYSLVYGYTPFHNIRAQWAKVSAITNPQPKISFAPPAGSDAEPTPPILIDVMRKCLQHDPKARPTVAQLLQIPYIPVKPIAPGPVIPEIPANILMKIKYSLSDAEWRQFTEILEARRNQ